MTLILCDDCHATLPSDAPSLTIIFTRDQHAHCPTNLRHALANAQPTTRLTAALARRK